jgi:hypothetical protein
LRIGERFGDAEVDDINVLAGKQDVLRFHIAVHDLRVVCRVEHRSNRGCDAQRLGDGKLRLATQPSAE